VDHFGLELSKTPELPFMILRITKPSDWSMFLNITKNIRPAGFVPSFVNDIISRQNVQTLPLPCLQIKLVHKAWAVWQKRQM
jgi:hypothetical protein